MTHFESRQLAMVKPAYKAIVQRSPSKPVIAFVPSRKIARHVAMDFLNMARNENNSFRFIHIKESDLLPRLRNINNDLLKKTLKHGIAFYHKRMTMREKMSIESLFKANAIQIVIAEQSTC